MPPLLRGAHSLLSWHAAESPTTPSRTTLPIPSDLSFTPSSVVQESMERGLLMRKRMRHELARALLTSEDDSVVHSFLEATNAVELADEPDHDLIDALEFVDMYTDLDDWAARVAEAERRGIQALCRVLQREEDDAGKQGKAVFAKAPALSQSLSETLSEAGAPADEAAPVISSEEDFRRCLVTADSRHISRLEAARGVRDIFAQPGCERLLRQLLLEVCETTDVKIEDKLVCWSRPSLRTDVINVYALFPGWPWDKSLSLHDFISEWLVDWLQVQRVQGSGFRV